MALLAFIQTLTDVRDGGFALGECVGVMIHAAHDGIVTRHSRWWLVSLHAQEHRDVQQSNQLQICIRARMHI
jgi:hypothetical protein